MSKKTPKGAVAVAPLKTKPWRPDRKRGVHKTRRVGRWARMREHFWPSMGAMAWIRWVWLGLLRQADNPHYVALGFAVGVWVAFFPILGVHVPIALALCWVLRGSFLASLAGMWVGNPWTYPFIWPASYHLGMVLLGRTEHKGPPMRLHEESLSQIWAHLETIGRHLILPTMTGGVLLGVGAAILAYGIVYMNLGVWKRRKNALKMLRADTMLSSET